VYLYGAKNQGHDALCSPYGTSRPPVSVVFDVVAPYPEG